MKNLKYFKIKSSAYETTRHYIDNALNLPNNETCFEPLAKATITSDNYVLLAIRSMHLDIEPYKTEFGNLLENSNAIEISEEEFISYFPQEE